MNGENQPAADRMRVRQATVTEKNRMKKARSEDRAFFMPWGRGRGLCFFFLKSI